MRKRGFVKMAITGFDSVFSVDNYEYGYTVEDCMPVKYGEYLKLYVPKLMGAITFTGKDFIKANQLIVNSKECWPDISKKIQLEKYMNVQVRCNDGWENKVNENGIIPKNTEFIVEFINGNIQRPFTTTK